MAETGIKEFELNQLNPADYNPRRISNEAMDGLKKSLARFGCVEPIVVNIRDNANRIVGGHQRYKALLKLNIGKVQCVTVDLSDADERILNITLNNPHLCGEFIEDVGTMIESLRAGMENDAEYFDLRLDQLRDEIGEGIPNEGLTDPDDVPEIPKKAITKTGDVWLLGEHRVLCGDSTKREDVEKLMQGEKADMVFTDPPYGVNYEGGSSNTKKRKKLKGDDSPLLYKPCLQMTNFNTTDTAAVYLWFADMKIQAVIQAVIQADYKIRNLLIWNKLKAHYGALGAQYKQRHEPFLYLHKNKKSPDWYGASDECTVWDVEQAPINEFHPTQKPVALAERAMGNSSRRGDIILDLFLGSGSTLIACEQTGRKCYGMEIDPLYCDVIVKRWQEFTGKKAELAEKAATFAHVEKKGISGQTGGKKRPRANVGGGNSGKTGKLGKRA